MIVASLLIHYMEAAGGDGLIHLTLGGSTAALIGLRLFEVYRTRNGNGKSKDLADDMHYWDRMREQVTEPICKAINELEHR